MGSRGGTGAGEDRRRVNNVASPPDPIERNLLMFSAMSGPQGWADLPDGLLHSIVALLGSFPDLLAFAATCPSWRAAFSSYPCKSLLLPPLFLQPDIPVCSPRPLPFSTTPVPKRPCYITDLANQNKHMCCEIPLLANSIFRIDQRTPLENFYLRGASYGNLILSNKQSCVVVDVFTGVSVSPPQLPVYEYPQLCYGALTSPLASPNSHLMLTTRAHHFFWRVGSHSWLRHPAHNRTIKQLLTFKDQVFGMAEDHKLFIMHLAPRIRIQEIRVDWEGTRTNECFKQWLVACGEMLLMVGFTAAFPPSGKDVKAFRLDLSSEPAKWVKLKKLENCAIFVSFEEKSQPLCCINPERWGGRSNCIYCCYNGSNGCITLEFGEPVQRDPCTIYGFGRMLPMWVVPSMFS